MKKPGKQVKIVIAAMTEEYYRDESLSPTADKCRPNAKRVLKEALHAMKNLFMKKYRTTEIYSEVFWMHWCVYSVVSSFASVYLQESGYTNTEIGILLAVANGVSVLIQPIAANAADRSKKFTVFDILMLMAIVIGVLELLIVFLHGKSPALFVTYVLIVGVHASMQPLLNSLSLPFARVGIAADYGISRSMGSLGYALMSAFLGVLVASVGAGALPIVAVICLFFVLGGLLAMKHIYKNPQEYRSDVVSCEEDTEKRDITMGEFVKNHRLFMLIAVGIFVLYYHHQIINFFLLQIFQNVGGDSLDMGLYYSLMSFLEIPALIGFSWLNKRFSTSFLLKLSVIGLVLRGIFMYAASTPLGIQLSLIVNPIGFPLFLGAIVKYINEIMDTGEAVRGQSMYVIAITVSAIVATFTGGILLDGIGAKKMLFLCLVLCIIGAAIILPLVDKAAKESAK